MTTQSANNIRQDVLLIRITQALLRALAAAAIHFCGWFGLGGGDAGFNALRECARAPAPSPG